MFYPPHDLNYGHVKPHSGQLVIKKKKRNKRFLPSTELNQAGKQHQQTNTLEFDKMIFVPCSAWSCFETIPRIYTGIGSDLSQLIPAD